MKPDDILTAYHMLWKIEESFRIMKSTLEVRPIFHWTPRRIKGHFVICFLAFLLERKLEKQLHKNNIEDASTERIREAINRMEFAEVELKGESFYIKTRCRGKFGIFQNKNTYFMRVSDFHLSNSTAIRETMYGIATFSNTRTMT